MLAKDLMRREVFTIRDDQSVADLTELLVREHIHGVPVVDRTGRLVGMVTQQDVFFDSTTKGGAPGQGRTVGDLMTSPAVVAAEETEIEALCRMMCRLRIHRVPITRDAEIAGIVSSLDVCRAVAEGRIES
jgi:CBS domain-containing protein